MSEELIVNIPATEGGLCETGSPALIYPRLGKHKTNQTKKKTLHSEQPENERWSQVHPKLNMTFITFNTQTHG